MASLNKVTLIGRIGKFGEFKEYKASKHMYTCSIATSKKIGDVENTSWHNITMFDRVATNASSYAKVGDLVLVEGEITYKETEDGKRYTNIIAHNFLVLSSKVKADQNQQSQDNGSSKVDSSGRVNAAPFVDFDDEIPF